jgi:endoglucanase
VLWHAWKAYLRGFVQEDGRVIDHRAQGISTSEGQTYAMLRAVWADDQPSFDLLRRWTQDNLQAGDPSRLPAWKWGKRPDNSWGVLDQNPATDADQWLAWSLLLAHERWGGSGYRDQARSVIRRIREEAVATVGGRLVLLPGPWARAEDPIRINPSYLLPFAWRDFARFDETKVWTRLLDDSYVLLGQMMSHGRLPPDWAFVAPQSGELVPAPAGHEATAVFGFEAIRIPWTLAAEVAWHEEPRAQRLLTQFADLAPRWRQEGRIAGVLKLDGSPAVDWPYLGLYGALLPAWALGRPQDVDALYERHLLALRNRQGWGEPDDYYAQNWTWLGVALWSGVALPPEKI